MLYITFCLTLVISLTGKSTLALRQDLQFEWFFFNMYTGLYTTCILCVDQPRFVCKLFNYSYICIVHAYPWLYKLEFESCLKTNWYW